MITIHANNATLTENEQSLCALCLCCLAAVRFNGIVQVGKGLKAHESNGFAMAGGGSGGNAAPAGWLSACSPYQCASQVSLVLLPRSGLPAVPARMSVVVFVAAETPSSGSTGAGAARELPWAALEGHTDTSLW